MARRRFFVDGVLNGSAAITGDEALHLTRVLRVETGEQFEISDHEHVWLAEVVQARKSIVEFKTLESIESAPAPASITLYTALFKFDRFEWMLEKVTELGVTRVVPVETERSDHGLYAAAQKRVERWRRIVREASQQSRRLKLPVIDDPLKWKHLPPNGDSLDILLDELPETPLLHLPKTWVPGGNVSLFLGPEGGWTGEERATLASHWTPASLGPTILRAETAAISAVAILANSMRLMDIQLKERPAR